MAYKLWSKLFLTIGIIAVLFLSAAGYRTPKLSLVNSSSGSIDQSLLPLIVNSPVSTAILDSEGNDTSLQPVITEPNIPANAPLNPPIMLYGNEGIIVSSIVPGVWKVWFDNTDKSIYSASIIKYSSSSLASQAYSQIQSKLQSMFNQILSPAVVTSSQPYSVTSIPSNYGFELIANLNSGGSTIPVILYADLFQSNNVDCLNTILTINAQSSSAVPLNTFNTFSQSQYNLLNEKLGGSSNLFGSSGPHSGTILAIIGLLAIVCFGSVIYGIYLMNNHRKAGMANAAMFTGRQTNPYGGVYNPQSNVQQSTAFQPYNPYGNSSQQTTPYANSPVNLDTGQVQYQSNPVSDPQNITLPIADWYKDPEAPAGSNKMRYWDGTNWTDHYHDPDAH